MVFELTELGPFSVVGCGYCISELNGVTEEKYVHSCGSEGMLDTLAESPTCALRGAALQPFQLYHCAKRDEDGWGNGGGGQLLVRFRM